MNTLAPLQNQNGGRGGRPPGRLAIVPPGHAGVERLAALLGVSPTSVPRMMMRGDPRIPPRSPIAGTRRIWRICDIEALIGMAVAPPIPTAHASPFATISVATPAVPEATPDRSKKGRARGTGKFSK